MQINKMLGNFKSAVNIYKYQAIYDIFVLNSKNVQYKSNCSAKYKKVFPEF